MSQNEIKKRRNSRRKSHLEFNRLSIPSQVRNLSGHDGLEIIRLSTATQKAISCVVGDHISVKKPWHFVSKEKIEDDINCHKKRSDFFPIANYIHSYPDLLILFCLKKVRDLNEHKDVFNICTTVKMKDHVLSLLEEKESKVQRCMLEICAGTWKSLGSETEIFDETLVKLRPLIAIDIECKFPIFNKQRVFSLSLAYPDNLNFVEFLTKKRVSELVYKRRGTSSIQKSPVLTDKIMQTMQICHFDQNTQYEYEVKEVTACNYRQLMYFLNNIMNILCDNILVNSHINLHQNDYKMLVSKSRSKPNFPHPSLLYFRDTKYCTNKMVSSIVWHPTISGLVAVAYNTVSLRSLVNKKKSTSKRLEYMDNVILIWCYSNCLKPKLILHSKQEIVSLCFCPNNQSILIGGCTNGQILIWDLTNVLEEAEKQKVMLTKTEEHHRIIISSLTKWMILSEDTLHIQPTASSNIEFGHHDAITSISWISSNFNCTRNGKIYNITKPNESLIGNQFITCGLDGMIYIWDLNMKCIHYKSKKKNVHLSIFKTVSPFRQLNNAMIPLFKIVIPSPFNFLPLMNLLICNQQYYYEAVNPETANDMFTRTYFKAIKSDFPEEFIKELKIVSSLGAMLTCSWNGNDYDQGQLINQTNASNVTFLNWVHDTPIHTCSVNPIYNNVLLTIGGKIFAIWNIALDNGALIWRKNKIRYSSGLWSVNSVGVFVLFRIDSKVELWDILTDSRTPSKIINQPGLPTIDLFVDDASYHVTKQTYFKSDGKGNLVLAPKMSEEQARNYKTKDSTRFRTFENDIIKRRHVLKKWLNGWKEKHLKPIIVDDEVNADIVCLDEPRKSVTIPNDEEQQHRKLFNFIMEYMQFNAAEIEKNRSILEYNTEKKNKLKNKLNETLKNKQKIFEFNKKKLLETDATESSRKLPSIVTKCYGKANYDKMKQLYMQSYYETEKNILKEIGKPVVKYNINLCYLIEKRQSQMNILIPNSKKSVSSLNLYDDNSSTK